MPKTLLVTLFLPLSYRFILHSKMKSFVCRKKNSNVIAKQDVRTNSAPAESKIFCAAKNVPVKDVKTR
jgi:hypothetical protein